LGMSALAVSHFEFPSARIEEGVQCPVQSISATMN